MTNPVATDVKQVVENLLCQLENQDNEEIADRNGIHYVEIGNGEPHGFVHGWKVSGQ